MPDASKWQVIPVEITYNQSNTVIGLHIGNIGKEIAQ